MRGIQAVVLEPFKTGVREVELPPPAPNQILVAAEVSAISAGTELAVYTGTHQWLKDPNLPDWKFPFRPGYSAAGKIIEVGSEVTGWKRGDRVSFPGNHASAELLTLGHERCRLWKLPENLEAEKAAWACIARYGMGASIRAGITLGRSAAVLGLGIIGQFSLRCLIAAGAHKFTLKNRHLPSLSVYLFNAAQPRSGSVHIIRQKRNEQQSTGEIEFTIGSRERGSVKRTS